MKFLTILPLCLMASFSVSAALPQFEEIASNSVIVARTTTPTNTTTPTTTTTPDSPTGTAVAQTAGLISFRLKAALSSNVSLTWDRVVWDDALAPVFGDAQLKLGSKGSVTFETFFYNIEEGRYHDYNVACAFRDVPDGDEQPAIVFYIYHEGTLNPFGIDWLNEPVDSQLVRDYWFNISYAAPTLYCEAGRDVGKDYLIGLLRESIPGEVLSETSLP